MKFSVSPAAHRMIEGSIGQSECYDRISKEIRERLYGEFTIRTDDSSTCIRSQRPIGLYYNSFEPSVLIDISKAGQSVSCKLSFSLSNRVKRFTHLFCLLLVLFELILIICRLTTEAMQAWALLIPFGMIAVSQAFIRVGFNIMVNTYTRRLTSAIERDKEIDR